MYFLGDSFMDVCFRRQFFECIFWETVLWMYVLGDSVLNVCFGRQFYGCMF